MRIEGLSLSPEQQASLNQGDPSHLPDKDPGFVKQTWQQENEEQGAEQRRKEMKQQAHMEPKTTNSPSDTELDDLFEDGEDQ